MGKLILISLSILLPVLALILTPWLISLKHPEQSWGMITSLVLFGVFFLSFVGMLIYQGVTGKSIDLSKTKLWNKLFGKL